jgi:hypothetical protein
MIFHRFRFQAYNGDGKDTLANKESIMSMTAAVPVTIAPEATAHIAEFGLQRDFEQVLDHVLRAVPELRRVEVTVDQCLESDSPTEPALMITALVPLPEEPDVAIEWAIDEWLIANFPPATGMHFVFRRSDVNANER